MPTARWDSRNETVRGTAAAFRTGPFIAQYEFFGMIQMAIVTLRAVAQCPSGGHITIRPQVNSVTQSDVIFFIDELFDPIEDPKAIAHAFLKLHSIGKTNAQMRADLIVGFAVNV